MIETERGFYVIGGTLRRDAPCYVERKADRDLYEGLKNGRFCYVLTSRQMGKSSLMVRASVRLREEGIGVVVLDLTAIGFNVTPEQWYDGLLEKIGQQLDLEDELENFWVENSRIGPLQRWMRAIREVVLVKIKVPVVVFVDEIDAVRSLPFSTDEFFAGIREFYNRRTEDAELNRLIFCLLGVATPSDLIRDTKTTPFNIGTRIELNDFTESESASLAKGLGRDEKLSHSLLKRAIYWTGGHPYLTQRLCLAIAEDENVKDDRGVDRLCENLFLSHRAREKDDNLLFVRERMLRSEVDTASILDLYSKVHKEKRVDDEETNRLIAVLRLSGIVRVKEGVLRPSNRIYRRVFDQRWVIANMPDADLRRQKAAERRGLLRAAAVASVIIVIITALLLDARSARNEAVRNESKALKASAEREFERQRAVDAQKSAEVQREEAERQRIEADQQRTEAERQKAEALKQKTEALKQKNIAQQRQIEAEEQRRFAEQKKADAYQQSLEASKRQVEAEEQKALAEDRSRELERQRAETESQRSRAEQEELLKRQYAFRNRVADIVRDFERGADLIKKGKVQDGCIIFDKLLQDSSNSNNFDLIHYKYGETLAEQGLFDKALIHFQNVIDIRDADADLVTVSYLRAGKIHDLLGERNEAVKKYNAALKRDEVSNSREEAKRYLDKPYALPGKSNAAKTDAVSVNAEPRRLISVETAEFNRLRVEGFKSLYNIDYDDAREKFTKLTEIAPDHPAAYFYLATNFLFDELNSRRRLQIGLYSSDSFFAQGDEKLDEKSDQEFRRLIAVALNKSEKAVARNGRDPEALYYQGAIHGLLALYEATVSRSFFSSLGNARKAVDFHRKVLLIDPNFVDAYLTIGTYDYIVGSLPLLVKIFARLGGISGSRTRGLRNLKMVAESGKYAADDASVTLITLYGREKRYAEILEILDRLSAKYSRNYLFKLERANMLVKLGRPEQGFKIYDEILHDKTSGAITDLAHYQYGEALARSNRHSEALSHFLNVETVSNASPELVTRSVLRAGNMCDLLSKRTDAIAKYNSVLRRDEVFDSRKSARKYIQKPYRDGD